VAPNETLSSSETLELVVRALVPGTAECAIVQLLDPDGSPGWMTVAHADPAAEALAREHFRLHPLATGDDVVARAIPALGLQPDLAAPLRAGGRPVGALALFSAAREPRDARDNGALERERRHVMLLDSVQDTAIVMLDPGGHVASWNAGAQSLRGFRADEILGEHLSRFYPDEAVARDQPGQALRTARDEGRDESHGRQVRKDGSHFFAHTVLTRLSDEQGAPAGFSEVTRDVTERTELEALLSHQALHDDLTGLPNRALFVDRIGQALARAERRGGAPAVLFVDLDGFKLVNDSLGHAAGDELLVEVAGRLAESVRPEDTVARLGGDEFSILCEALADRDAAVLVAERVARSLTAPIPLDGRDVFVDASIGIMPGDAPDATPESLLRDADTAMYRAKELGRGGHQVFDEGMRPQSLERLTTEGELRRALEAGQLRVFYQPVFDVRKGDVVGVEALARWIHPRRGLIEPRDFIPLAEETRLILPIGAFVLETACRQARRWNAQRADRPPLLMLVNLSARQAAQHDLPQLVERTLAETGADATALCLEITESVLMSDARTSAKSLLSLKDLGVRLAIDDFGTGYSSLGYLRRFPVDYLKVDASFVNGLGRESSDSALVAAITSMAHALGVVVIAEGVERSDQLAELRELGCELAQGYHLRRPQPAEALDTTLSGDPAPPA
jgi:diguanylate cyclase (GGDEF)-like protein/PAS domain S-box-containing protein